MNSTERTIKTIAAFEAFKGTLALLGLIGILDLLHHDIRHIALLLIDHFGHRPDEHISQLILGYVDAINATSIKSIVLLGLGYVAIRWAEAYGLWHLRPWGEWLGALSGALYVPFEVRHLMHKPTWLSALVLMTNAAVVAFLAWRLWRRAH